MTGLFLDVIGWALANNSTRSISSRIGYGFGVFICVIILVGACGALLLMAVGTLRIVFGLAWIALTDVNRAFDFIGSHLAGLGAWAAATVGAASVTVLAVTNRTRAREATNNDFRDFMQWALERLDTSEEPTVRTFAYQVISEFAPIAAQTPQPAKQRSS